MVTAGLGRAAALPARLRARLPAGVARRWVALGIRGRVLAWFVVLLALATVTSVVLQRQILHARLIERIDAQLNQEAEELRLLIGGAAPDGSCISGENPGGTCEVGRDPATGQPFGDDVGAIFDTFLSRNNPGEHEGLFTYIDGVSYRMRAAPGLRQAGVAAALAETGLLDAAPVRGEVPLPQGTARFLAVPVTNAAGQTLGVFAVAQLVDPQLAEVSEMTRVALTVGLSTLVLASLVAYLAAGRLLAPLRSMSDTARAISAGDFHRRIKVGSSGDELSALAHTFNEMLERLATAFNTQRRFIDDAGHELRTPITIIRGHLELLGDDPDERRDTIAIVTDELDRMNRMVDDLLVLAKAEQPDFLSTAPLEVGALTDDLLAKCATLAPRRWRLDHRAEGLVIADRQRLTQAVVQLAQNATQHTETDDTVALGSQLAGGEVRLWVRDEGPGVPAEDAERIFARFARGGAGRRRSEGAGLGLSIVRAIAEAHGGRVELHSAPGAGATFTLVLPASTEAGEQLEPHRHRRG